MGIRSLCATSVCLLGGVLAFPAMVAADDPAQDWTYKATSADVRPIALPRPLTEEPPPDLVEEVPYRGTRRWYAQFRYGSQNSRRVVAVLDELGDGQFDCYVDSDRDRTITAAELVPGQGRTRQLELDAEILRDDTPIQGARRVELRYGALASRLYIATLGYIEGRVAWREEGSSEPRWINVRRVDGDANGLFTDSRDQLHIDFNEDGNWEPIHEQFPWLPIQRFAGRRFAARSDRLGQRFELSEVHGVGTLRVVAQSIQPHAKFVTFEAVVYSDDGSAYAVKEPNSPMEVPVGKYAMESLTLTMDTEEGQPWHFVFSRSGDVKARHWVQVSTNEDVVLEAIGKTRFQLTVSDRAIRAGSEIVVQPWLHTEQGLLINHSSRRRQVSSFEPEAWHNRCRIRLVSEDGETLSMAESGFA